jgi:hypothetical protein
MSLERRIARLEAVQESLTPVPWDAIEAASCRQCARVRLKVMRLVPGIDEGHPGIVNALAQLPDDSPELAQQDNALLARWRHAHPAPLSMTSVLQRLTVIFERVARRLQAHHS